MIYFGEEVEYGANNIFRGNCTNGVAKGKWAMGGWLTLEFFN